MSTQEAPSTKERPVFKVKINPSELIAGNPAFAVLDRSPNGILAKMLGDNFNQNIFNNQLPSIVKVVDTKSATGFKWRPIDHHRIVAADEHQKTERGKNWDAYALDITQQYTDEGQLYLTPVQYRALVNSADIAHRDLLHPRMVMHFFRDWPDIVGKNFPISILAALSLLSFSDVQDTNPKNLPRELNNMGPFMVDETAQKRESLIAGILQLAKEIKDPDGKDHRKDDEDNKEKKPRMAYSDLGHPALDIFAREFDDTTVDSQIKGFFVFPSVHEKLIRGDEAELTALIKAIMEGKRSVQDSRSLYEALTENLFSYDDLVGVLTPSEHTLTARYMKRKNQLLFSSKGNTSSKPATSRSDATAKAFYIPPTDLRRGKTFLPAKNELSSEPLAEDTTREPVEGKDATAEPAIKTEGKDVTVVVVGFKPPIATSATEPEVKDPTTRDVKPVEVKVSISEQKREGEALEVDLENVIIVEPGIKEAEATIAPPVVVFADESTVSVSAVAEDIEPPVIPEVPVELKIEKVSSDLLALLTGVVDVTDLFERARIVLPEIRDQIDRLLPRPAAILEIPRKPAPPPIKPFFQAGTEAVPIAAKPGDLPGKTDSKPEKKVSSGPTEGTLAWFEKEAEKNKDVVAKMLDDAAQSVFKGEKLVIDQWENLRAELKYNTRQGFVSGLEAIREAIVQNVITIVKAMRLDNKSPEFAFLAAAFYWHANTIGRHEETTLAKEIVDAIDDQIEMFENKNKLKAKSPYLQALLYTQLSEPDPLAILQSLASDPFSENLARAHLNTYRKKTPDNSLKRRFRARILREVD